MVYFAETNQIPPPYSMLQHIGRVVTPKLCQETVSDTSKQHLGGEKRRIGLRTYARY